MKKKTINLMGTLSKFFKKKKKSREQSSRAQTNKDQEGELIAKQLGHFQGLKASEVMIPCADIIAVRHDTKLAELHEQFIKTAFTRIPVYKSNLDEIIGFIHVKDIVPYLGCVNSEKDFHLPKVIRKPLYAARSTKCLSLLTKMRLEAVHVSIILDEYGCTEGMVTIENLVEEIVGEIKDEHDSLRPEQETILKTDDGCYIIDAKTTIADVAETIGLAPESLSEEEGEYQTIGGFVMSYLDRIPDKGEKFTHPPSGIRIEILDADQRKIKSIKLSL